MRDVMKCNSLKNNRLTAKLLLVLVSTVVLGSESYETHDRILLSDVCGTEIYRTSQGIYYISATKIGRLMLLGKQRCLF
jgi:hypothetical protein